MNKNTAVNPSDDAQHFNGPEKSFSMVCRLLTEGECDPRQQQLDGLLLQLPGVLRQQRKSLIKNDKKHSVHRGSLRMFAVAGVLPLTD